MSVATIEHTQAQRITRLYTGLELNRIDGEISVTEPNSREDFGIVALLNESREGELFQWDVRVLHPETCEVVAAGALPNLSEAKMFAALTLAPDWDLQNQKLVAI